ncbi:MAG: hypothetical protein GC155_11735 [Alphaproteobacteria bacterium]|nr:hypothetical protein [Alphaproteobacteria bacterium]
MSPERKRRDRNRTERKQPGRRQEVVVATVSVAGLAAVVTSFALTGATEAAAFAAGLGTGGAGVYLAMKNRLVAQKRRGR